MKRNHETLKPPSLAQHFDAPEDYIGHFGWLCGYSADALFLDDAAERFTRLTRSQRNSQSRISLAALLDPGNPPVSLREAPGVAHLPIIDHANKPFRLLHAKVALLGFRHQENHGKWQLRLLVSTGNWTRQTLEESLDLIWRIDLANESLSNLNTNIKQDCADIKAAWDLLAWIQKQFDTRLLNASVQARPGETKIVQKQVSEWIATCVEQAQGQPRFFDNRKQSLLSQLPEKIKAASEVKRNYLAMSSGFYETSDDPKKPPEVPLEILKTLRDEGLLTKTSKIDLYVNPHACQAIATSLEPLQNRGITVRPAAIPPLIFGESIQRSLHAKFLFSANVKDSSNACTSPWIYLGSGNLTHPGFARKMNATAGNLEAGVVFAPDALNRQKDKATPANRVVTNLLPIQWDEVISDTTSLSTGSGMEPRDTLHIAPPVAWLEWYTADNVYELRTDDSRAAEIDVLDSSGVACSKTDTGFHWNEAQPREVCIRWEADHQVLEAQIPVIDQYGRIAATVLPAIDIDEAWWQLADFPMPPDDDDESGNTEADEVAGKGNQQGNTLSATSYPIRQLMELIESIAAKQTGIDETDWPLWCNRLEQILGRASDSAPVTYFRDALNLNPLSPLRQQAFRPTFAETGDTAPGKLYEAALDRIEAHWKVSALNPVGGAK